MEECYVFTVCVDHDGLVFLHSTFGVQAPMGEAFSRRATWFAVQGFYIHHSVLPSVPISLSYSASSSGSMSKFILFLVKAIQELFCIYALLITDLGLMTRSL